MSNQQRLEISSKIKTQKHVSIPVSNLTIRDIQTEYWRTLCVALRIEIRLYFNVDAVKVKLLTPENFRCEWNLPYETTRNEVTKLIAGKLGYIKQAK